MKKSKLKKIINNIPYDNNKIIIDSVNYYLRDYQTNGEVVINITYVDYHGVIFTIYIVRQYIATDSPKKSKYTLL